MDSFEKDAASDLAREKFVEIMETIFKNFSRLEKDAILFQVNIHHLLKKSA